MANYEFECSNCGNVYEVLDPKNRAGKRQPCQECGEMNNKIMSAVSVVLKPGGVGWAKDGYSAKRSLANGPEDIHHGSRHKRSGGTIIPVRGESAGAPRRSILEPNKSTAKKKKPMIKVKK
jgi:putative FmdB family regulatory protein